MTIKPVKIGAFTAKNNVFAAPLAGYTDFAFRKICYLFGAGLCFTEMVSAKGLVYNNEATAALLYRDPQEYDTAAQLFGNDPHVLRSACESEALAPFPVIDLNMGCPVPKIYKNGEGSALLNDLPLAEKIISACKKSGKNITVKFRVGIDEAHIVGVEFAKMCEGAGADLITVHGRTRDRYYAGEPNYDEIEKINKSVRIPVIAKGGIFCRADADRMLDRTGADGIMLARAILYNPDAFAEILQGDREWNIRETVEKQINDMLPVYGERFTVVQMRKMTSFYIRGTRGCAQFKNKLFFCDSLVALRAVLEEIFT